MRKFREYYSRMNRPSDSEIAQLKQVAREMRESASADGHTVELAIDQNAAFGQSRGPSSGLERALIVDAARRGASQSGLGVDAASGGLDIIGGSDGIVRKYRVKRITRTADGSYDVICGEGSSLLTVEPSLFAEEKWLLGFITTDEHTIDELVAAEIVGWRGDGPVHLTFGTIIDLSDDQPPRGFTSTDEGLEGFDEDEGDLGQADSM